MPRIGIGLGIGRQRVSGGGVVFDADYQAVLNYAISIGATLPSSGQQTKQNQLMLNMKSSGAWAKLDTFAMFATDGNSVFALIDWKRLTTYTNNSCTFTANQGFTGNGSNGFIDTNFNPSTNGVNYMLNNASRYYMHFAGSNLNADGTTSSTTYNQIRIGSAVASQTINSGSSFNVGTFTYSTSKGIKSIHRTSSLDVSCYNDATGSNFLTVATTSLTSATQVVLRRSSNYSNNTVFGYAMGASLIAENTAFVNALNTYINSL